MFMKVKKLDKPIFLSKEQKEFFTRFYYD